MQVLRSGQGPDPKGKGRNEMSPLSIPPPPRIKAAKRDWINRQSENIILNWVKLGGLPEWSIGPVSKSGVCHRTEGSNPSPSFENEKAPIGAFLFSRARDSEPSQRVRLTARERSELSAVKDSAKPNLEGYDRNEVRA